MLNKILLIIDTLMIISLLLSIIIYFKNNKQKYLDKIHNAIKDSLYLLNINKLDFKTNLDNKKINNKFIEEVIFLNDKLIPLYSKINCNFDKFNYNYDYYIFCKDKVKQIILKTINDINNDKLKININNINEYIKIKNEVEKII